MQKGIRNITHESFGKYGYVIAYDSTKEERFQVILGEKEAVGWRIAVSRIISKSISKISRHPHTMESFEPVDGVAVICVAPPEAPEEYEFFLLDKPVCLYRNVWHATMSISDYATVKISENLEPSTEGYPLKEEYSLFFVGKK